MPDNQFLVISTVTFRFRFRSLQCASIMRCWGGGGGGGGGSWKEGAKSPCPAKSTKLIISFTNVSHRSTIHRVKDRKSKTFSPLRVWLSIIFHSLPYYKNLNLKAGQSPNRQCREYWMVRPAFHGMNTRRLVLKKTVFSAWASTLNMGLINKVDMVCLSPVGYDV